MPTYVDQMGREVEVPYSPQRIVSLVPSQTELLFHLGLEHEVVGITKFCIHPGNWFRKKDRVGGTKNLNRERIRTLKPDLILANKEENVREQIEELATEFPVWISDVSNLSSALEMILSIGSVIGKDRKATEIAKAIETGFRNLVSPTRRLSACYLIWQKPFLSVGSDTFIHDMLIHAGFENVFAKQFRYPEADLDNLPGPCDVVLLSSEPYPFSDNHVKQLKHAYPHLRFLLVDGEAFSWYGSRLLHAPEHFAAVYRQALSLKHAGT